MKKFLILVLAVLCMFTSCSGNEKNYENEIKEHEFSLNTPYVIHTKREYKKFLEEVSLPEEFVPFEVISCIGSFKSFYIEDREMVSYIYKIKDEAGVNLMIRISSYEDYEILQKRELEIDDPTDMRLNDWNGKDVGKAGVVTYEGIKYSYDDRGALEGIWWRIRSCSFVLVGDLSERGYLYPRNTKESTFVSRLLSFETAVEAMDEFVEAYNNR